MYYIPSNENVFGVSACLRERLLGYEMVKFVDLETLSFVLKFS